MGGIKVSAVLVMGGPVWVSFSHRAGTLCSGNVRGVGQIFSGIGRN